MKKVFSFIFVILIAVGFVYGIKSFKSNQEERQMIEKYEEAVDCAVNDEIEKAKLLFSELPKDFKPYPEDMKHYGDLSPDGWLNSINKYYYSDFIGDWEGDDYKLHIARIVSENDGVYLSFDRKAYSPSGVGSGDMGTLNVSSDGKTADFTSLSSEYGGKSNSKYYDLKLVNQNTIELYFKHNLEATLYRV